MATKTKKCLNCGKLLIQTEGKREKKYCNSDCRSSHFQRKQREDAIVDGDKKKTKKPKASPKVKPSPKKPATKPKVKPAKPKTKPQPQPEPVPAPTLPLPEQTVARMAKQLQANGLESSYLAKRRKLKSEPAK